MNKYYLRIEDNNFGFVVDGIHDIQKKDIEITQEDYDKFFELQSKGKQFRVIDVNMPYFEGIGLFDIIEEYEPVIDTTPQPPTEMQLLQEEVLNQSEMMLDIDFRLTSVELGL